MASDGANPPNQRYNYKHAFDAIARIKREEGLKGLWIGSNPAACRCMVLNLTQIVLYKNTKTILLETSLCFRLLFTVTNFFQTRCYLTAKFFASDYFEDNFPLHIICSTWTALASAFATAPIDIIKTR